MDARQWDLNLDSEIALAKVIPKAVVHGYYWRMLNRCNV